MGRANLTKKNSGQSKVMWSAKSEKKALERFITLPHSQVFNSVFNLKYHSTLMMEKKSF